MPRRLGVACQWALGAAAVGCAIAAIFAAIHGRLHRDLAHGDLALTALRFRDALRFSVPAGVAGLATVGLATATFRASSRRVVPGIATLAAAAAAAWAGRDVAWEFLLRDDFMERGEIAVSLLAATALAAVVVAAHVVNRRGMRRAVLAAGTPFALAGLLAVAALPAMMARRSAGLPDVLLVSLDTLRADRTGFHGYARPTTPRLDALAAQGVVLDAAHAAAPWTLPSHASLFTSLEPREHGAVRVGRVLRPHHRTLAEAFRAAGYRTGAFTGGGYVSWGYGFGQGFEVFEDHDEVLLGGPAAVIASARRWLAGRHRGPVFVFLHTYEPHGPYTHAAFVDPADQGRLPRGRSEGLPAGTVPTEAERRYVSDLYDGDIRHCDDTFGAFLEGYVRAGSGDAIVVVTSDHGEDLWDHDALEMPRHGHTLYQDQLLVPLFLRAPGRLPAGARVSTPVSQLDLAPTIAALAGIRWRETTGRSIAAELAAGREPATRPIFAEATRYGPKRFALRDRDLKAIYTPNPGVHVEKDVVRAVPLEAFDLASDPGERTDRSADPDDALRSLLRDLLGRSRRPGADPAPVTIVPDDELLRQLRSLGYVDAPPGTSK